MITFYLLGIALMKRTTGDEGNSHWVNTASESEQAAFEFGEYMGVKRALDNIYIELQGIIMRGFEKNE